MEINFTKVISGWLLLFLYDQENNSFETFHVTECYNAVCLIKLIH